MLSTTIKDTTKNIQKDLGIANIHEVPRIVKVIINVGAGGAKDNPKLMPEVEKTLKTITGQKPVQTAAKKSVASFKLRQGNKIGAKITLRGRKMYDFLDRLINVSLPRIRDFRGLSDDAFDSQGNYHLGLKEQTIFAEIPLDNIEVMHGMEISIVTTAADKHQAEVLLRAIGLPIKKSKA